MRRRWLPSLILIALAANPAYAQLAREPSTTDVLVNVGYAASPSSAPDRVTVGLGMSYWFAGHLGAAWGLSAGAGSGGLILQTVTLRYRQPVGGPLTLIVGAGFFGGRYDSSSHATSMPGGVAYEVLLQKATKHLFSFEGGLVACVDGRSIAYRQAFVSAVVGFR